MNGSTKLSVAIALALLGGGNAFALGLGAIQVKSGLNQPLNAEIAVIADSPAEAAGLNVSLARAEDFQRVGLDRTRVSIPIDFEVITTGRNPVVRLTTKDPVREPFLDFLVEANWAKGRVLREYTVLLDPPVMAPALRGSTATVAPAREAAPASPTRLESPPPPKAKPEPRVKPPRAVAETKPAPAPKPAPLPKPAPTPAATRTASTGEYGPVAEGETLSEIARSTKDENTDTNAMMLALLQANPNAFYKDNINALKRGAILRIPSHDDVKAAGNLAAAAAAVREQNQNWTSGNVPVSKPTLVAKTGEPKSTAPAPTKPAAPTKPNEHLALVPPVSAKGGQTSADQPGPASGTGSSGARGDLARTKESLASREQEVGELKSRVKELEDINTKDTRLLTLKQSEVAELQARLKELETKTGTTAKPTTSSTATTTTPATPLTTATTPPTSSATSTTKPADATASKTEPKLTAQDIWGKISDADKNAAGKPSATTSTTTSTTPATTTTPSTTTTSSSTTTTPSTATTPSSTSTTSTAMTGPSSSTPVTTTGSTPPSTTTTSTTTTPPTTGATPSSTTTTSTTTPSTTPSSTTTSPTTATTTPSAAAVSTPAALKPKPTPSIAPIQSTDQPWYQNTMTLAIAGGALFIVGLLALMGFLRKPKPVLLTSGDGDALVDDVHHYGELPVESEAELLDALAQHPGDPELSLKLLRMYYAEREATKFEAAAEAMYAHIADPTQPEWREVKAMGEDLVPHNPLFGGNDDLGSYMHESVAPADHETMSTSDDNFDLGGFDADGTPASEENFDFDLTDHAAPAPVVAPAHAVTPPVAAAPTLVPTSKPAEDFFAGEDTIGTKLDLARAYLDMGDPEGARSMLDEVMSEGNDTQKGEARKLLAEIK
jgi:pilus assembly protein FimV